MKILLTERFQRDMRDLSEAERASCLERLLSLPKQIGSPHAHSGAGLRKLHRSGVWEVRMGLGLRLVFTLRADELVLVTVGTHDAVRRFLAAL